MNIGNTLSVVVYEDVDEELPTTEVAEDTATELVEDELVTIE